MAIRRFLIMTTTANEAGAGTDDEVFLDIGFLGRTKSIYVSAKDFPNGAVRKKIETGKATIYLRQADILLPSAILPAKNTIDSIILRTEGDDAWLPSSFFLFGIGSFSGRPDILIPLVHIPNWNLGRLSIDEDEGRKSIPLPHALIEELDITFPGDPPGGGEIGFTLATSSGGTQISISIPKTSS